jgi:Flp pilus assembly protein TadB
MVLFIVMILLALLALNLISSEAETSMRSREVCVRLDMALANGGVEVRNEIVDYRKQDLLSAIYWINRCLPHIELETRLNSMLSQANIDWTPGELLLMCIGSFAFPAYLIHLATGTYVLALMVGALMSYAPVAYVLYKRNQRLNTFELGLQETLDRVVIKILPSTNTPWNFAQQGAA